MNPVILFTLIVCIVLGVSDGLKKMHNARCYGTGIKESDNIFKYFFCDRYR